jgi:hypothetical protein
LHHCGFASLWFCIVSVLHHCGFASLRLCIIAVLHHCGFVQPKICFQSLGRTSTTYLVQICTVPEMILVEQYVTKTFSLINYS